MESVVAERFGYAHAALFGRARSAVVALLDILGLGRDAVFIMPSNICSVLLLAVHSRGIDVSLAAVSRSNGLASDTAFVEAMKRAHRPGIVMPTHLYGFVQEYRRTVAEAKARGWFVLENDPVATKVRSAETKQTAFGDALLLSFGYAKGIEAGGGGALLTNDASLVQELRARAKTFPLLDNEAREAEERFMLVGRQLRNDMSRDDKESILDDDEKTLIRHAPPFEYQFPDHLEEPLLCALNEFPSVIEERRRKVAMWSDRLEPLGGVLLEPHAECVVPWRLVRRMPRGRDRVVTALRNGGIDAGTNFPPLTASFPRLCAGQRFAEADQWGREVLNLWISRGYDARRMTQAVETIGSALRTMSNDANA